MWWTVLAISRRLRRAWRVFLWLPFRWRSEAWHEERRLRGSIDATDRIYGRLIAQAKTEQEREDLFWEGRDESKVDRDELAHLLTREALRKAERYGVPEPPGPHGEFENDAWERCDFNPRRFHLTDRGLHGLRRLVRQEAKERRDAWIPLLSIITTLTAVLALLVDACRQPQGG